MLCTTIIPTIGRSSLERAVVSAVSQELSPTDHEVIIVNDSGTALAASNVLSHPQVRIVSTNRVGEGVACNVGAGVARGEFINFVHDDDSLLQGALQSLLDMALATGSGWTAGGYEVVTGDEHNAHSIQPRVPRNPLGLLVTGECIHIGASLLNRRLFLDIGGFDTTLDCLLDRDLQVRFALTTDFSVCEQVVARIRASQSPDSSYRGRSTAAASRVIREKALGAPQALNRITASVGRNHYIRGRVFRNYIFSAGLNLLSGRFWTAVSRIQAATLLANYHLLHPLFWKGVAYKMQFADSGERIDNT